jgi:outer membrane protein assembly factor BamB
MKYIIPSLALILAGTLETSAGDWRQFRGPHGNGISAEANLPVKLEAGKSVAWQIDLPGQGLSSPIIVGDRVFITCSSGPKEEKLHIICLRASDGSKLWSREFRATGRTMCHEKTAVATPTPTSDGERIFAIFSSNDLICLDLDGNLVWLRGLGRDYPNASNSLGMSSSLVTADGVVVAMVENDSESFTAGLDAMTGVNRWKLDRPKGANWSSPALLPGANGRSAVALQSSKGVLAVDVASGQRVWEYTDGASTVASPTLSGGLLFVPSFGLTVLEPPSQGATPKQLWRSPQLRPGTPSPVVLGDKVFALNDGGVLTCGDVLEGKRLWQLRLQGPFSATPVGAGAYLYCVNEKGLLQVVDTTKVEGEVVSDLNLGEQILATPSISGGALYLRSDTKIWKVRG